MVPPNWSQPIVTPDHCGSRGFAKPCPFKFNLTLYWYLSARGTRTASFPCSQKPQTSLSVHNPPFSLLQRVSTVQVFLGYWHWICLGMLHVLSQVCWRGAGRHLPPGVLMLHCTGGADKTAVVFQKGTEQIVAVLKGHSKKVTGVIYHPREVSFTD